RLSRPARPGSPRTDLRALLDSQICICIVISMATRTIYVRDEKLWNRARKLADVDGLSAVIHDLLTEWVRRKEAETDTKQMAEVELAVGGEAYNAEHDDVAERTAFTGRLI